jgi:hypothetical protein
MKEAVTDIARVPEVFGFVVSAAPAENMMETDWDRDNVDESLKEWAGSTLLSCCPQGLRYHLEQALGGRFAEVFRDMAKEVEDSWMQE